MRRFVFLHDPISIERENEFLGFMKGMGAENFWKWTPCAWLFVDAPGTRPVEYMVDGFMKLNPGVRCFVFEFGEVADWQGFGPSAPDQGMFKWVENFWKVPDLKALEEFMLGRKTENVWSGYNPSK